MPDWALPVPAIRDTLTERTFCFGKIRICGADGIRPASIHLHIIKKAAEPTACL